MRIMTTNIWGDYFGNPVEARQDDMFKVYEKYDPDIIGLQEITRSWHNSEMFKKLRTKYYFVETEPYDNRVNCVPLAIRKDYKLLARGYEVMKDTNQLNNGSYDISKGITWAVVMDKGGKTFAVFNTHFSFMTGKPEFETMRAKNAKQLCSLMNYVSERFECPAFAFGDMNCKRESAVFKIVYLLNGTVPLFDQTENRDDICSHHGDPACDEQGLYHGVKSLMTQEDSIDHIVGTKGGYKVLQYRVVEDQFALDATDHSPVYADIELD